MSGLEGVRVLIVEDESIIAMTVEDLLLDLGCVIVGPCPTVESGCAAATREAIDIALLDVNLNGKSSTPIADLLRERAVPIVFATGYGAAPLDDHADALVLPKPYSQERLAKALSTALSGRR